MRKLHAHAGFQGALYDHGLTRETSLRNVGVTRGLEVALREARARLREVRARCGQKLHI